MPPDAQMQTSTDRVTHKTRHFQDPEVWRMIVYTAHRTKQRTLKPHCGAKHRSDLSGIDPGTTRGCGSSLHCRECLGRSYLCTQVKLASGAETYNITARNFSQAAALSFCSDEWRCMAMLSCNDKLRRYTRNTDDSGEATKHGTHCQPLRVTVATHLHRS